MSRDVPVAAHLPALPRLGEPVPRSGVVGPALLGLRQYLSDCDRDLGGAFRSGGDAVELVAARCGALERAIVHVWRAWLGDAPQASLIAVGGFGRGELFPCSDVDLLVLTGSAPEPRLLRALESFFTCLWDIGLKPGHSVRDAATCRALAASDITVYTNLLDARLLAGQDSEASAFIAGFPDTALWSPQRFVQARRDSQAERHRRFGDTTYNLEPQIKDGPGGLRDLQLIDWLLRVMADGVDRQPLLDAQEREVLAEARAELYRVRYALHLHARRGDERLLLNYQRELATDLGYRDEHARNLDVEQFMQDYFRAARRIARANDIVLERAAERLLPPQPREPLGEDFVRVGDRVDFADPGAPRQRPELLVELFEVVAADPALVGIRADASRSVRRALADPALELKRPAVHARFRSLLERGAVAVDAVSAMARHGVLARLIPAFAQVSGRMQYDLFHVYTVDEHTLRVLRFMARFGTEDGAREFALAHEVNAHLARPPLLLLAGLFHDIAKGRGGDHSELGEVDARAFCTSIGLPRKQLDLVAWLVRWHLIMSTTAQRQDITDSEVIERFAAHVGDIEHLDYLYVLTVADICATNPKLWNAWKAQLLADLYRATRHVLLHPRIAPRKPHHAAGRIALCSEHAGSLLLAQGVERAVFESIWSDFPDHAFLRHRAEQIAWQTTTILHATRSPIVAIQAHSARGASEVFIRSPDRDGLFATITAVLDRLALDVVEARVLNTRSGQAQDSFLVLEADGKPLADAARAALVERALRVALEGDELAAVPPERTIPRVLRHFRIAPRIRFSADAGPGRTRMALVCTDRPGLLAAVAQTFRACGVRVHDARIATFGERVEDYFVIATGADQALDQASQNSLRAALIARIDTHPTDPETRPEHAAN